MSSTDTGNQDVNLKDSESKKGTSILTNILFGRKNLNIPNRRKM